MRAFYVPYASHSRVGLQVRIAADLLLLRRFEIEKHPATETKNAKSVVKRLAIDLELHGKRMQHSHPPVLLGLDDYQIRYMLDHPEGKGLRDARNNTEELRKELNEVRLSAPRLRGSVATCAR